jgi:hypothetical protein
MANSQAVATVTIQDQDLLSTVSPLVLVTRSNFTVTTTPSPSVGGIFYGGYLNVSITGFTALFVNASPFVYIRNATASTDVTFALSIQFTVGGQTPTIFIQPGGVFLYANPILPGGTSTITNVNYAISNAGKAPVIMEYLYVI